MWNIVRKSARDRLAIAVFNVVVIVVVVERKKVAIRAPFAILPSGLKKKKKKAVDDEFSPAVLPIEDNEKRSGRTGIPIP